MPSTLIANIASDSGRHGESYILQIRASPRPFLKYNRVVEACAMILPPIGFFGSAKKKIKISLLKILSRNNRLYLETFHLHHQLGPQPDL